MEITPELIHGIVNRKKDSLNSYQGWPSIARDENGTLYVICSGFRAAHICPFGKTVMYISKNNGETWTPPIVVSDTYLDDRDAGILYMGNGRMLVTWFNHTIGAYGNYKNPTTDGMISGMEETLKKLPPEHTHGGSYIKVSEDYGVTWSDAIKVDVSSPHGPNLLRDGSLVYLGKEMWVRDEDNNTHGKIRAIKSTDGGYTWTELGEVAFPEGTVPANFHEPHVIELPDGRLLGAIRAQGKGIPHEFSIYTTYSSDGGKTWTTPVCTDVSGSPPHLLMHSSGALICTYGRREAPYAERAMVSYDCGETWEDDYLLDTRPTDNDLGYPATVELDDGSLLTVYYQKLDGDTNTSILFTKWKLK